MHDNTKAIREYRAAAEAAEYVPLANGLREVIGAALDAGEISTDVFLEVGALLDEVRERVGTDGRMHARRATRLRDGLVMANKGLVYKVAMRTLGSTRKNHKENLEEAVQEGYIGLMRAIEDFDETRGVNFSTPAVAWIKHHVQNCIHKQTNFAKQRSACMPYDVRTSVERFRALKGRDPEPEEIGTTREQWDRWLDVARTVSVDDMSREGEEGSKTPSADALLADESTNPDVVTAAADLRSRVAAEMSTMSPRNRAVTQALFIDGRPLIDVAKELDLAPSRVHQIKTELEKRLRKALAA